MALAPHCSRSVIVTVAEVIVETPDAKSFVIDVPTGTAFGYRPGQFITVRVPSELTGSVARCYSLASAPGVDAKPKFTVKATPDGYGSQWLCREVTAGDELELLPPSGVFVPHDLDADVLLIAAGSGVTPVMSILKSVLAASGTAVLFYANRDRGDEIFAAEINELLARYGDRLVVDRWYDAESGHPTVEALASRLRGSVERETFVCGPGPFMTAVHDALAAVGADHKRVHTEPFNSLSGDPFVDIEVAEASAEELAEAATVDVELDGKTHSLTWPKSQTLVDILLAAGLDAPYSCQEGECGSCVCTVTSGSVEMANNDVLDPEDVADGYVLGCQARPTSGHVTIEF